MNWKQDYLDRIMDTEGAGNAPPLPDICRPSMEEYHRLELVWAEFNGLDPGGMVACSSGTAALHLALEALEMPSGSKVIVPDFTMISCARAVALAGLTPVFFDCKEDLNLDVDLVASRASREIRAVMPVHIYGRRVEMDQLIKVIDGVDWFVIEDLAEAHGVRPHPDTDVACWSFYKNKIVAGEEGGACWFKCLQTAERARLLRSLGFTQAHDFRHIPRGHNYRMSNAHASLILANLAPHALGLNLASRRAVEFLCDSLCPPLWKMPGREAPWVYDICLPWSPPYLDRAVEELVGREGIPARHGFKPMHLQEEFKSCQFVSRERSNWQNLAMSSQMARTVLYLPLTLSKDQVERAFALLKRLFLS